MPSRYLNPEAPQSGLDAFLTGAATAYTGVKDERRKRQVESQQDALLRQQMQNAQMEQERKNAEGGFTYMPLDGISEATAQIRAATAPQASGVRAKIGAILARAMGAGQETPLPTGTLVKTGPSAQETLARIGEEGANTRNAASIASARDLAGLRESGDTARTTATLDERWREANLEHGDRLAGINMQNRRDTRLDQQQETRDLRDYGRQLNEEILSLQRMAADKMGIMQEVGATEDDLKGGAKSAALARYQERMRQVKSRISDLHRQLDEVNATMSRRAIGSKLASPQPKAAPAGLPSRPPTLQEDLQAAMRP